MRKFIIPIVLLIVVAGIAAWYFFSAKPSAAEYLDNSAFRAVPIHSPIVVELQNAETLAQLFSGGNMMIDEMKEAGILKKVAGEVKFIGELMQSDPDFAQLCKGKPALISANFEGKNEVSYIFLVSMKDKREQNLVLETISDLSDQQNLSKRSYDDAEIYKTTVNNATFSFAFTNGIFVACQKPILVEEAIRQSNAESLLDNPNFIKLNKTSNPNTTANIYINHKTIGQYLGKILNREMRRRIGFLENYSEFTELDLRLKNDELFLSGFSFANDSVESYINLFKKQAPGKSDFESVLPYNTSLFLSLNIEKPEEFLKDYEEFSRVSGSYYQREARLMAIKSETKTDFLALVNEMATGLSGIAFTSVPQNEPLKNRFFVMGVKSQSVAREKMESLLEKYLAIAKIDKKGWRSEYRIDEKRSFTLYQFPYPDISEVLFGKIYSGVPCNFFTFYDNYLIFADSQAALKDFLHTLILGETLSKDAYYLKFKENTSARSNLHFYFNFSKAFHLSRLYLDDVWMKEWYAQEETMRKFYALSWQFSNTNRLILNTLYLKFDPEIKEEPQTIWQTRLNGNILTQPLMVVNHNDPANKEVIVQDQTNNLHLINKEGVPLWNINLEEPILSDILQIDIYRNNKFQYLFNTRSKLYLIDRNGNPVKGFPVVLSSPATNGVAIVDYDNNKDYRFLVAGEDKQVYAYYKDGKPLKGWNNFTSDHPVERPIRYIRVQNKDYLVFFDRYKTYFLDRQGKERLVTNASFDHSGNDLFIEENPKPAILCTDKKGAVYRLFFDGNFEKLEPAKLSANHYFVSTDMDGNGRNDFIFADGNQLLAFSETGVKLFAKEMKKPISEKPEVVVLGEKNKKIGVVSASENKVYLFHLNGSVYGGFPLQGNTRFCVGNLSKGNKFFNLLVGNDDGSLLNYMLE